MNATAYSLMILGISFPLVDILNIMGVVSFVLTVVGIVLTIRWTPRRSNEPPRKGRPLRSIRYWRPSHYSLALGYLLEYCERLDQGIFHRGSERGRVTELDLVRWIVQIALTCAAQMVPQSLGKANLFRVSQISDDAEGRMRDISIYSSEFVGIYSPNQMVSTLNGSFLRRLHLNEHQATDECPAALRCIAEGLPIIQSMKQRRAAFDDPERSLGTTHILAFPLVTGFHEVHFLDQIISVTVDLKFGAVTAWILDHRDMQKMSLFRRAMQLSELLRSVPQLSDPRFIPLVDRDQCNHCEGDWAGEGEEDEEGEGNPGDGAEGPDGPESETGAE